MIQMWQVYFSLIRQFRDNVLNTPGRDLGPINACHDNAIILRHSWGVFQTDGTECFFYTYLWNMFLLFCTPVAAQTTLPSRFSLNASPLYRSAGQSPFPCTEMEI
jgi:hypothetical protein